MGIQRRAATAGFVLAVAGILPGAHAQQPMYQCRTATGSVSISSTPCQPTGNGPIYYGPPPTAPTPQRAIPGVGEAPEYITYMSPRCSGLHDALRTAPARGLDHGTQAEMRRNYQRECAEDESQARTRWSNERGEKKQLARREEEAQRRAQERTKQQQEQCGEAKRILVTKRARTDLTEGERAELQRFEANYKARCT